MINNKAAAKLYFLQQLRLGLHVTDRLVFNS